MSKSMQCSLQCNISTANNPDKIIIHGAQEHNLKNICFEIPKGKLIALTGPSGSGKSSIATDILQKESIRQFLDSMGMVTDHLEKAKANILLGLSPSIGVTQRISDFNPRSTVGTRSGILTILRNMFAAMGKQPCTNCKQIVSPPLQDKHHIITIEKELDINKTHTSNKTKKINYFHCPNCNQLLEKLKMAHFSSNTLEGACKTCTGTGTIITIDLSQLLDETKTIKNGGVAIWNEATASYYEKVILAASKHYNFSFDTNLPIKNYTIEQKSFLLYGITSSDFIQKYTNLPTPKKVSDGNFEGIIPPLLNMYKKNPTTITPDIKKYFLQESCTECKNTQLAQLGREVTIEGKTITDVSNMSLDTLLLWINTLNQHITKNELSIFSTFYDTLQARITNLIEVGLSYLTLNRSLPSLSGGESQRVKLANLLGSGLTGVLYVLDEPTTGLHPHDNIKLLNTARKLQELGNTVLIIEHDMDIVRQADYILDLGPLGGSKGGEIVAYGTPSDIIASTKSITGKYLAKKTSLNVSKTAQSTKFLIIKGAREHNLKNIDVIIPINQLVVFSGVSGSGKSTLLFNILDKAARKHFYNSNENPGKNDSIIGLDYFNRIVTVNQKTIGQSNSARSNVATYTKLFDIIRDLFASLPNAKARGLSAEDFSFNTSDQRCTNCSGAGTIDVEMNFMPNIQTICPLCNGMRFNEELLAIQYQGHNISNILNMTIQEAISFFKHDTKILSILQLLRQVGLDYLTLGQSTSTLSGGEAQRLKLAAELSKSTTGKTLYLLDEPTTGLHPQEVEKLILILQKLVSQGNTIIVIEHNLEVISQANTIIDFGPGGGNIGGKIIATGSPQEIIENPQSLTGKALKSYISYIKEN